MKPEMLLAETKNRSVLNHRAVVLAETAVERLAHRAFCRIASDHAVYQFERVVASNFVFIQRRDVDQRRRVPNRVILVSRASRRRSSRQNNRTRCASFGWRTAPRCENEMASRWALLFGSISELGAGSESIIPLFSLTSRTKLPNMLALSKSPAMPIYDAIIIGAGHNGLTSAAYLAKAGKKVLVLERRHVLGGAAVTEEIYPGFKYSVCSYVVSLLRPEVIRDLELPKYDLEIIPLDSTFTPLPDGDHLFRCGDHARTRREIARHSTADAEAYEEYGQLMVQMAMAVKPLLGMIPPEPTTWNPKDLFGLARVGNHFRGLGEKLLYDLTKLMTMSSADFLDEWFETDALKATMSASGIIGTFMGPRSPGTAYVLLHHYMGELDGAFRSWGFARGGMGSISRVIADAARHHGAEIRTQAPVDQVLIKNGRAHGVVLATGEEIQSKVIVSGVDPKRTFLKMIDGQHLDARIHQAGESFQNSRLVGKSQSGAGRTTQFH